MACATIRGSVKDLLPLANPTTDSQYIYTGVDAYVSQAICCRAHKFELDLYTTQYCGKSLSGVDPHA